MARRGRPPKKVENPWSGKTNLKLNIGCGTHQPEGYINIDKNVDCDLNLDLEEASFPFGDGSVSEIAAFQVIEHISRKNLIPLMNECHRVLEDGGKMLIEVPCYPSPHCFSDPTHVNVITTDTFDYFDYRHTRYKESGKHYGITPWKLVFKQPENWNLKIELHK